MLSPDSSTTTLQLGSLGESDLSTPMRLLCLLCLFGLAGCLEMDGFLADEESLDEYELPGNTIPNELIEPVSFESEGEALYGFWVASSGERPGITMLYFHGN